MKRGKDLSKPFNIQLLNFLSFFSFTEISCVVILYFDKKKIKL